MRGTELTLGRPPPPPPAGGRKSTLLLGIGLVLLVADLALVGLVMWERFSGAHTLEAGDQQELKVGPLLFFDNSVRVEVSHRFTSGYYYRVRVRIESGSGLVWEHEFDLESPGSTVETKTDSEFVDLSPGTYYVSVSDETKVDRTRLSDLGWLFVGWLFPGLALSGIVLLDYSDKPGSLASDVRKAFSTSPKGFLTTSATLAVVWFVSVLALALVLMFLMDILGLIVIALVLGALGLIWEGVKRVAGVAKARVSGAYSK